MVTVLNDYCTYMLLTLKELLICHINYRDVFNAPVEKESLKIWVGTRNDPDILLEFDRTIRELKEEKLIVEKDGYIAIFSKENVIDIQIEKSLLSTKLLLKGKRFLTSFGKLPFIKFVGISGSVAAQNPTLNHNNHVDLDIFIICAKNTLWVIFLLERIFTNIVRAFNKGNHFYCFNYVTEECFLEIYNKNFYTASEIINLKPVVDKGVYKDFIEENQWFEFYYAKNSIRLESLGYRKKSYISYFLKPVNYFFYVLFYGIKALKKRSLKVFFQFTNHFDPTQKDNLMRISNPSGGYQDRISNRFEELLKINFEKYHNDSLVEELFPNESKQFFSKRKNVHEFQVGDLFQKYA